MSVTVYQLDYTAIVYIVTVGLDTPAATERVASLA